MEDTWQAGHVLHPHLIIFSLFMRQTSAARCYIIIIKESWAISCYNYKGMLGYKMFGALRAIPEIMSSEKNKYY